MRVDFGGLFGRNKKALQGIFACNAFFTKSFVLLILKTLQGRSVFGGVATCKIYKVLKTRRIKSFVLLVAKKSKSVERFVASDVCELLKTKGLKTLQRCMFSDTVRTLNVVAFRVCIGLQRFWCFWTKSTSKTCLESRV